jgi:hypothetical protein
MKQNKKEETTARIMLSLLTSITVFILLVAPSLVPAVFAAAGSLDPTFGSGGKVITDFGGTTDQSYGVALQTDKKIVVAGRTNSPIHSALARYDGDVISNLLHLPLIRK